MINANIGLREDYTNLLIKIGPKPKRGKRYPLAMEIPGWRVFPPARLVVDHAALDALRIDPEAYGQALGEALFTGSAGKHYGETLAVCQGRGNGLRVRLLVEAEDLQGLHWERVFQQIDGEWHPLGSTAVTPFSRYVPPQQWERPQPVTARPLRVLAVIASPEGLEGANLDPVTQAERQALKDTFVGLPELQVTWLESGAAQNAAPTLENIRRELAGEVHFVHFMCHGARTSTGSVLLLEDESGAIDAVSTERVVGAFKAVQKPPLFCFLTACESAERGRRDGFLPLGPALVEDGGVQAAVAMTDTVGMDLARVFTGQFYTRLLKHGAVDLAVNEARALVQDRWDWGVPVLFSRLHDNQLIDFPIGGITEPYLAHTGAAFIAVDEAIAAARLEEHGQELVYALEELVKELSKSNVALVKVAGNFRRTGMDPKTFARAFELFYYDFKEYYDGQVWLEEQTSCNRILELRARILPRLAPILNDALMDQLRAELDVLGSADNDLIRYFKEYLDLMNGAVEAIYAQLSAGDVEEALQSKRDFEAQISPSFQRNKALFDRMASSVHAVSRAD